MFMAGCLKSWQIVLAHTCPVLLLTHACYPFGGLLLNTQALIQKQLSLPLRMFGPEKGSRDVPPYIYTYVNLGGKGSYVLLPPTTHAAVSCQAARYHKLTGVCGVLSCGCLM